ncbi:MAG: c-type cytochrome [Pseudomonadota bacterium]
MIRNTRWLAFALATASLPSFAAGNADAGRVKANTCMGCHGIPNYNNVYPTYRVPKLGGQSEGLIVSALKAYKSGERVHKTMRAQTANLSDQDMADIAAYLAHASPHPGGKSGEGANSELEKAAACIACHGPNGAKPTLPDAAVLAGQYNNYLKQALHDYQSGARKNAVMAAQVKSLSKTDIQELAKYFSAQESPLYTPSVATAKK